MIKLITIVGARPQFIKAAAISRAISKDFTDQIKEILVHTGQHYDENMSSIFFDDLNIPQPKYNLEISGGTHGAMTGKMLGSIEQVLIQEKPDWVLVYGDTNSTLAGALAAAKLNIPVAHVEAGLRSFNMRMPEEINRIVADRISSLLLCPTGLAVENLRQEGVSKGVYFSGDVMYDVALQFAEIAEKKSSILTRLNLLNKPYILATCHRAENTNDSQRLKGVLTALNLMAKTKHVVFPIHPRTKQMISRYGFNDYLEKLIVIEPVSYFDMIILEKNSNLIVTDSGGIQKEAFFFRIPCITIRDETEWIETVNAGWNEVAGTSVEKITQSFERIHVRKPKDCMPFGNGQAALSVINEILRAS